MSRSDLHAVRALAFLAQLPPGRFAGANRVADRIRAPRNYLGKLLRSMTRSGIVESRKGLGGGFRLSRDPTSITLLDVLGPIERPGRWGMIRGDRVGRSADGLVAAGLGWSRLGERYLSLLSGTTIADLAQGSGPVRAEGREARFSHGEA